jgi:branched-chain amino acid transport system ATP-binding protein
VSVPEPGGLNVEGLVVSYGAARALNGVTMRAPLGRVTCVVGRNGAGKSTLFGAIMGLVPRGRGSMQFSGVVLEETPAWKRVSQGLALVPEGSGILSKLTVYENLRLGAFHRRLRRGDLDVEVNKVVEWFPVLGEKLRSQSSRLSGGERQMLSIGRALMADPKIILLDEPSFGLAPLIVENLFGQLQDLASQGYGVLMSEQNAAAALAVADYGFVLDRGVVAFEGLAKFLQDSDDVRSSLFA